MISLFLLICLSIYQSIYAYYMWLCWPSDWRMSRLHSNMALIEKLAISHISSSSFLFAWDPRSPFWSRRQSVSKLLQDVANPCREMLSSILSWTDFCWNCKSEGNIQRCKLVKSNGNASDLLGGISQSTRPWSPFSRITGSCGTATCMGRCGCLRILYDDLSTIAGHNLRNNHLVWIWQRGCPINCYKHTFESSFHEHSQQVIGSWGIYASADGTRISFLVIRSIIRMDEFIDWLMREETICDVGLAQCQPEVDN